MAKVYNAAITTSNQINYNPTGGIIAQGIGTTYPYTINYPTVTATYGNFFNNNTNTKYSVLSLPRKKKMPKAVYVCGKMLTLGLLGTDVECGFTGDKIVFAPGVLAITGNKLTLIIEYADESYHYNLFNGLLGLSYATNSQTLLDPQLLSVVRSK